MVPRSSRRLLADNGAYFAENVKLASGELRPLRKPSRVYTPNKPLPPKSVYRLYDASRPVEAEGAAAWATWPIDVDLVQAPLSADVESRFYWTGDGEPKMAEFSEIVSGGLNDFPHLCYALGIPAPQDKPAVSVAGGTGDTITRFYRVTFFGEKGEESAGSPVSDSIDGPIDGTWNVSNLPELPVNSGTCTATATAGVTTVTCSGYHWLRIDDPVKLNATEVYVRSVVSPTVFTVSGGHATATTWARVTPWNVNGLQRRLYRTTGTTGSWQLVAEDVGTTYSDSLDDGDILGDELISDNWNPPPAGLRGLCLHASGALCGFVGNKVYFSEPLQPHAWPTGTSLSLGFDVVGLAPFGSSIVAATAGSPYLIDGTEPGVMSAQKFDGGYPCVSKRSVTSVGDGALYSSNHGLIYVTSSGVAIAPYTDSWFTRDEWMQLAPGGMQCLYANGVIYVAYDAGSDGFGVLVIDGATLTSFEAKASALAVDSATGEIYYGTDEGISLFNPATGTYPMQWAWHSKDFVFPEPVNLGAAKIDYEQVIDPLLRQTLLAERADTIARNEALFALGGFFGEMNDFEYNANQVNGSNAYVVPDIPPGNDIQFSLWHAGKIIHQTTVTNTRAFRLPAGFKYDEYSFEIAGQSSVYRVLIGETPSGLNAI
jgi:hypothetical protein